MFVENNVLEIGLNHDRRKIMKYIVQAQDYTLAYCYACGKQDINKCDKQCFDKG